MNLRTKLILSITLILFIGFSLTNVIHYTASRSALRSNIVEDSLPIISNNIYSELQRDLLKPVNVSSLMANDTFVKDWLLDGENDLSKIQKYLLEIKQRYDFSSTFLISCKTLHYYHYEGLHKTIHPNDDHDVWYYNFINSNDQYQLDIDTDEASNNSLTIFINHRLNDYEGNLIGVTGAGLKLSRMGEFLAEYQGKFKRNIYLVDSQGVIQIHSNLNLVEKINVLDGPGILQFRNEILNSKQDLTFFEFNRVGKHFLLLTRYIPEFNWYLFVEQDETPTMASIRTSLFYSLIFGIVITCFIIVINVITINFFQSKLEHLAAYDELTHALNRRTFLEKAALEFSRCRRYNKPLSVLMIDLDYFKKINDTYGHSIGDVVLKQVGTTCLQTLRDFDLFGRMGGEEFTVLLVETNREQAEPAAQRLLSAIKNQEVEDGLSTIKITASIGMSMMAPDDKNIDDLLQRADHAMYDAKNNGRNRLEISTL